MSWDKLRVLLEIVLVGFPIAMTMLVVFLSVRQARFLRELTRERGLLASILALSWRDPPPPNPRYLSPQPRGRLFRRGAANQPSKRILRGPRPSAERHEESTIG